MNILLQTFYKWCAKKAQPTPRLADEMREEAELLHRDTVERQLRLIDDQFKVSANKAKVRYLLEQVDKSDLVSLDSVQ